MIRFLTIATLLVACTSTAEVFEIKLTSKDVPDKREIHLGYINDKNFDVCIGPGNWPFSGGIIDNDGDKIYIIIDGRKHFIREETDYCPNCTKRVPKGSVIESRLLYSSFGLTDSDFNKSKVLFFKSFAEKCPPPKR